MVIIRLEKITHQTVAPIIGLLVFVPLLSLSINAFMRSSFERQQNNLLLQNGIQPTQSVDQSEPITYILAMGIAAAVLWYVIYMFLRRRASKRFLDDRTMLLQGYASSKGLDYMLIGAQPIGQALYHLSTRGLTTKNVVTGPDWRFFDFSYDIYRKTKNGEYKEKTIFYSVYAAKLPRKLPHLFFDGKTARKRQFRLAFDGKQRHRLEGNFDHYFDTYFPEEYGVDALSIISPEVMEAIIACADYDVEISGDFVYLYGVLEPVPSQLEAMKHLGDELRQKLLHNIITYRDEALPYAQGRMAVAPIAATLNKNLTKQYFLMTVGVLLCVTGLLLYVLNGVVIVHLIFIGLALCIGNYRIYQKEMKRRDEAIIMTEHIRRHMVT